MKPHDDYQRLPPRVSKCGRYVEIDAGVLTDVAENYIASGVSLPPGMRFDPPEQKPQWGDKQHGKAAQAKDPRRRR